MSGKGEAEASFRAFVDKDAADWLRSGTGRGVIGL